MARTGRFGRLPRKAPNLSGEIVALLREYAAMRERLIIDAWQNGGQFEGKKVTDKMVLDFWEERMRGISKDDPLYEWYKNMHLQYRFDIAESKMTLAYAQHKVGEMAVANFYREWAGRMPRHSEVYRELMRNAARFIDAARERGRSGSNEAKMKAWQAADRALYDQYERAADTMDGLLVYYMRYYQYLNGAPEMYGRKGDEAEGGQGLLDLNMDLSDPLMPENDAQGLQWLLGAIDTNDEWRRYARKQLAKAGYTGPLDEDALVRALQRKNKGLTQRIRLAQRNDLPDSVIQGFRDQKVTVRKTIGQVGIVGEMVQYGEARKDLDEVWADESATFGDRASALSRYVQELEVIAKSAEDSPSSEWTTFSPAINGELRAITNPEALAGGRTVGEGGAGRGASDEGREASAFAAEARDMFRALAAVEAGTHGVMRDPQSGGWTLVPMSSAADPTATQRTLGTNFLVVPQYTTPYRKVVPLDDKATDRERFTGRGYETTVVGSFAYPEFVQTVPVQVVAPNPLGDRLLDPRTGSAMGGLLPSAGDDPVMGEYAKVGNKDVWVIYGADGLRHYVVGQSPFRNALGAPRMEGGGMNIYVDPNAFPQYKDDDPAQGLAAFRPAMYLDPTVIPGIQTDAGVASEGSALTTTSMVTALMAADTASRQRLLQMDDAALGKALALDPNYSIDPVRVMTEAKRDIEAIRAAERAGRTPFGPLAEVRGQGPGGWAWAAMREPGTSPALPGVTSPSASPLPLPSSSPEDEMRRRWEGTIGVESGEPAPGPAPGPTPDPAPTPTGMPVVEADAVPDRSAMAARLRAGERYAAAWAGASTGGPTASDHALAAPSLNIPASGTALISGSLSSQQPLPSPTTGSYSPGIPKPPKPDKPPKPKPPRPYNPRAGTQYRHPYNPNPPGQSGSHPRLGNRPV
jgi:hypothetical protein